MSSQRASLSRFWSFCVIAWGVVWAFLLIGMMAPLLPVPTRDSGTALPPVTAAFLSAVLIGALCYMLWTHALHPVLTLLRAYPGQWIVWLTIWRVARAALPWGALMGLAIALLSADAGYPGEVLHLLLILGVWSYVRTKRAGDIGPIADTLP